MNLGDGAVILRRLGSEACHFSRMHADQFINDCAYGSIGFIIYICHMNAFLCIYVAFVTKGLMVISFFISKICLPSLNNV